MSWDCVRNKTEFAFNLVLETVSRYILAVNGLYGRGAFSKPGAVHRRSCRLASGARAGADQRFFEILGGAGLLAPPARRAAAWGLIALYVAVFPANVNMALHDVPIEGRHFPDWALWLRLPLQGVLIGWA